ncbi:hypothetical protein [Aquabacterium sp.]|uniref:hypothetical protein n=1 Tax=Aquabacterium sp. TaxID=1872578 RepID=UPI0037843835
MMIEQETAWAELLRQLREVGPQGFSEELRGALQGLGFRDEHEALVGAVQRLLQPQAPH